jgi:hypothetical protein
MKATMTLSLAVLLALAALPATSQGTTAGDLLQGCGAAVKEMDGASISMEESLLALWCTGYVSGMLDGARMVPQLTKAQPVICAPSDGITNEQAVRIVVKHLRAKPEILHEPGRIHVLIALVRAFPCGSKS